MSYPDDFNGKAFEARYASAEDTCAKPFAELCRVHNVYGDMLDALMKSCKANHVLLMRNEIAIIMESVGEAVADEADHAITMLREKGYDFTATPDDADKMIDRAYNELVEIFRIKPIDTSELLAMNKPQTEM